MILSNNFLSQLIKNLKFILNKKINFIFFYQQINFMYIKRNVFNHLNINKLLLK